MVVLNICEQIHSAIVTYLYNKKQYFTASHCYTGAIKDFTLVIFIIFRVLSEVELHSQYKSEYIHV